jgi:hypothetical protein
MAISTVLNLYRRGKNVSVHLSNLTFKVHRLSAAILLMFGYSYCLEPLIVV